jgi:hypothetical protein
MLGSGCEVELVTGVLNQQHHPDLIHMRWQRPQQRQQPAKDEHRDVVHVDLIPWDAGVVDTQHRQDRRADRAGDPLGFPADRGQGLLVGVALLPEA